MVQKESVKPTFSIITCTRNSSQFIRKCLDSLDAQTFRDFEHIIIDGNSKDGTVQILKESNRTFRVTPPKGIANAMNAGIRVARGQYLYFLNSDDSLYSSDTLESVYAFLSKHSELDWVFGKIHETDGNNTIGFPPIRKIFQGKHPNILKYYNYIPHQAVFIKKSVFDRFGLFDESLKSMMDPEYWLRIARLTSWDYMPVVVANYLIRSDSQSENLDNAGSNTAEYEKVQHKYLSKLEYVVAKCINKLLR